MYQEKFLLEVLCEYVPEQLFTITKTLILLVVEVLLLLQKVKILNLLKLQL
jgi:hypothetical protein